MVYLSNGENIMTIEQLNNLTTKQCNNSATNHKVIDERIFHETFQI